MGGRDYIEQILPELLPEVKPTAQKAKVIHDSLWGSRLYYPWEVALMDTPLLQRLRQISQLGTAYLTYPSAVHNRFSHSLGVAILAGRLLARLREKAEIEKAELEINKRDLYTVRLAGLLHDVGHCFYSHCSEAVLVDFRDQCYKEISKEQEFNKKPKPHELIGYLILTSKHFASYWKKYLVAYFDKDDIPDPIEMAQLIVGVNPSKERKFLREVISGPYDVDKLEYLYRDAKTAGLNISYDIERFFYKIKVYHKKEDGTRRLVMEEGGIRAVEQLIFSKMMLFSFVYHHQKILSSDCVIVDMLEELLSEGGKGSIIVKHPLDFLKYTDFDIMSNVSDGPNERFSKLRKRLKSRQLPKRCFSLNREFVSDISGDEDAMLAWDRLKEDAKRPNKRKELREKIVKNINKNNGDLDVDIDSVYINIPKPPELKESIAAPIENSDGEIDGMEAFQNIEGWQRTYELKKFRGFVFAEESIIKEAAKAVSIVLKDEYGLSFKDRALKEAKIACGDS